MEQRLFWIGIAMGGYAWATRYGVKTGALDKRATTCLWHTLFCALSGFATTMVITMSIESRARFSVISVGTLSPQELLLSLGGGLLCGAWGGWRAWFGGTNKDSRAYYHTEDLEWAETVFSAVLLASIMMYFIVQAFKIPSGSMRNTLLEGDHLFVNKFIYGVRVPYTKTRLLRLRQVKRGDIVVFQFPTDNPQDVHCGGPQYGKDFIKRVVGLPGDVIQLKDGVLYRDGDRVGRELYALNDAQYRVPQGDFSLTQDEYQNLWETHLLDQRIGDVMRDNFGPVRVPEGNFFAMGDNRDHSCDSRFWGPVPDHYLKGKAWLIYWPPMRMGLPR